MWRIYMWYFIDKQLYIFQRDKLMRRILDTRHLAWSPDRNRFIILSAPYILYRCVRVFVCKRVFSFLFVYFFDKKKYWKRCCYPYVVRKVNTRMGTPVDRYVVSPFLTASCVGHGTDFLFFLHLCRAPVVPPPPRPARWRFYTHPTDRKPSLRFGVGSWIKPWKITVSPRDGFTFDEFVVLFSFFL